MTEGIKGLGIDTRFPQIDPSGVVHVDEYFTVDQNEDTVYFLGQKYVLDERGVTNG